MVAVAAGCSSTASETGPEGPTGPGAAAPFEGLYRVASGERSFDVNVESDKATVVRFAPGFEIGNPEVINGGDLFLKGLTRTGPNAFRARVAVIVFGDSPTFPKQWPASVSYVDTTIEWDEAGSKWAISSPKTELVKQSRAFDGRYDPAGACEKKFVNNANVTLYLCEYPQAEDGCSSGGEKAFWPSTDCKHLGYEHLGDMTLGQWQDTQGSNVTPGEHGKWGDGTGGGKIVNGAGDGGGAGGGGAGGCIVGTWTSSVCGSRPGDAILKLPADKNGSLTQPDCNKVCNPIIFPFTYEATTTSVALAYTKPNPVTCGTSSSPVNQPKNDTFTYTCSGNTLTTTTSLGAMTYTRL